MILYHGTNTDFDTIDLSCCAPYKDFGKGFYATTIFEQAKNMAIRKSRIYGGAPCVISYNSPDTLLHTPSLNVKIFDGTSEEWAVFIINNRNRDFADSKHPLCNSDNKYDIVFGPVANDTLATLIQNYKRGYIDSAVLLKEMQYASPTNQYSFHTDKATQLLSKAGVEWIK